MSHTHDWDLVYSVMGRQVRHCKDIKCDAWESMVLDWNSGWQWVPGNLWMHSDTIYIVSGTFQEFQEAATSLVHGGIKNIVRLESLTQLMTIDITINRPAILVWGTWYESPLVRDPQFAYLLNQQAG